MRDLIIVAIVFGCLPLVVMRPWLGILLFCWISFMNPHKLSYGFATGFPFAQVIALVTIVSAIFSNERNRFPKSAPVVILLLFFVWQVVTTLYAFEPDTAVEELMRTTKIYLMVLISLVLISRPKYLIYLVWVIAFSIGFFGIKGGVFSILTGGSHLIWGPPGSFIEGNNEIGLALLMVLPLFVFLAQREARVWIKRGLYICAALILVSVIATYSRGSFVGLVCMGLFLWVKSNKKAITFVSALVFGGFVLAFMPPAWFERMDTTKDFETDGSAQGRLIAWRMAYDIAADSPMGGGYGALTSDDTYKTYSRTDVVTKTTDAHSIYFEVLAEHGFIGVMLFLGFIFAAWRQGTWVIQHARGSPELQDVVNLCRMLQVSMVAYLSTGAFLGLAYFDLFYQLVAVLVLARIFTEQYLAGEEYPEWSGETERVTRTVTSKADTGWLPSHSGLS